MFITVKSKFQDHWPKYFKIIQSTCGMAQQTVVLFFHDMSLWKQEPSNALADSKTDSAITLSFSCILQTNAAKGSGIARCCSSQRSLGHPGLDSRLVAQRGPSAVRLSSWGPGGAPGFLGGMEAVGTGLKKNKNKKVCPVQKGIDSAFCFSWAASTVGIPAELKLDFEVIFFFFFLLAEALWAWCFQHSHSPPRKPLTQPGVCTPQGSEELIQCQAHQISLLNKELNKISASNILERWGPKARPRSSAHLFALPGCHSSISGLKTQHSGLH